MAELDESITVSKLLSDFKSDSIDLKIACAQRLSTIALALGPERLRNELLPALSCLPLLIFPLYLVFLPFNTFFLSF